MEYTKIEKLTNLYDYDFVHLQKTGSTMQDVKSHLSEFNKNCIFISDMQLKGRGRRGNKWDSPEGNIYCSLSLKNSLPITKNFLFNILLCTTIKKSFEEFNINNINFKWPNDIFYKNQKFAGVISETFTKNDNSYMVVGFGINIKNSPKINKYPTTHVDMFCNKFDLENFLLYFFKKLFLNFKKLLNDEKIEIMNYFKKSLMFMNKKISILLPDRNIVIGIFRGVNEDGSLKLEENKRINNIYNGSIII